MVLQACLCDWYRVLETSVDSVWSAGMDENHPVLLLRDTDAWSPYCQRQGLIPLTEWLWRALVWSGSILNRLSVIHTWKSDCEL